MISLCRNCIKDFICITAAASKLLQWYCPHFTEKKLICKKLNVFAKEHRATLYDDGTALPSATRLLLTIKEMFSGRNALRPASEDLSRTIFHSTPKSSKTHWKLKLIRIMPLEYSLYIYTHTHICNTYHSTYIFIILHEWVKVA